MTVGDLKRELNNFNDDTMVVILPTKSHYLENIYEIGNEYVDIRDRDEEVDVVILEASRQVGSKL